MDVMLSDAMVYQMLRYDTILVAHRLASEPEEAGRKLQAFVRGGGHLVMVASTLTDIGCGLLDVSVHKVCRTLQAPISVMLANGTNITEGGGFELCPITAPAAARVLARVGGDVAAVQLDYDGGGSLTLIGTGNYAMSTDPNPGPHYTCAVDEGDSPDKAPVLLVRYARAIIENVLQEAALFDLGSRLSWVPKRILNGRYSLLVTNSELRAVPLSIMSRIGAIASVREVKLDEREKQAVGYLPHGYGSTNLGKSNQTHIAGADTRLFVMSLEGDSSIKVNLTVPPGPKRRPLHLSHRSGKLRYEPLLRPSFANHFSGIMVDWEYLSERSTDALVQETQWPRMQKLEIVVDFTRGTTLFPGLRLTDDVHVYYLESIARIEDGLQKMSMIGSRDAGFALIRQSLLIPALRVTMIGAMRCAQQ